MSIFIIQHQSVEQSVEQVENSVFSRASACNGNLRSTHLLNTTLNTHKTTDKSITLDVLDSIIALKLKYSSFKVKVGTKNALDFQLTSYLGYLIGQCGMDTSYYIVSDDKGFEVVADFWREQNISVNCISLKEPAVATPKKVDIQKKKSKVSSKDLATLDGVCV